MKKILFIVLFVSLSSCDPTESLEANINNNSSRNLKITFISIESPVLNEVLAIEPQEQEQYAEIGFGPGSVSLAFSEFDSIYISDTSNKVLKVYKEDTSGKNIYNIDEYWSVSETSKNHFVYTYEITEEDLE